MYYLKLRHEKTVIEFANDWLGVERIYANGQLVSEKGSIWGATHQFTLMEEGHQANYTLVVRMNMSGQVLIDLSRDRKVILQGVVAKYGSKPRTPANKEKKLGILQLREYDIDGATELLTAALDIDPKDPEIYFFLACAYSMSENAKAGYEALQMAVANGLKDLDMIIQHDNLAFLRLQEAFDGFFESGYTSYDDSQFN